MTRRLRRFFEQPPARLWLLLEAAWVLIWVRLLLVLRGSARASAKWLGSPEREVCNLNRDELGELAWAVHRSSRRFPTIFSSLCRALVLQRLLARRGSRGTIRIGVLEEGGAAYAHAWLVLQDHVLLGAIPHLDQYVPYPGWPSGARERRGRPH